MTKNIVIIGAGFAGLMAALGASRLRHEKGVSPEDLAITVVSPAPELVIRPRLYERNPEKMVAPLSELFAATDINYRQGSAEKIDSAASTITVVAADGSSAVLPYDRLVLAAGSDVVCVCGAWFADGLAPTADSEVVLQMEARKMEEEQ